MRAGTRPRATFEFNDLAIEHVIGERMLGGTLMLKGRDWQCVTEALIVYLKSLRYVGHRKQGTDTVAGPHGCKVNSRVSRCTPQRVPAVSRMWGVASQDPSDRSAP